MSDHFPDDKIQPRHIPRHMYISIHTHIYIYTVRGTCSGLLSVLFGPLRSSSVLFGFLRSSSVLFGSLGLLRSSSVLFGPLVSPSSSSSLQYSFCRVPSSSVVIDRF